MASWLRLILWQCLIFALIFPFAHYFMRAVRAMTPRIGPSERLFPRKLIWDEAAMNKNRVKIAEEVMRNHKIRRNYSVNSDVEVRVVASNRGNSYLLQTIAFLLEQQTNTHFNVTICNVESEIFDDLRQFETVPIVTVGQRKSDTRDTRDGGGLNETIGKENDDYWKCLRLHTPQRYTLLMEDDSIVISQFSTLLKSLVSQMDENRYIDFVKLYHPNYLRKLPSYGLIIAFALLISYSICKMFKTFPFLTFLLLSGAISRDLIGYGCQFPADLRFAMTGSAYISYPESCCTPAVIFRTSSIGEMVDYFQKSTAFHGHAKDHILDESRFVGRQSDVNFVTHIGSFSSVRRRVVQLADLRDS